MTDKFFLQYPVDNPIITQHFGERPEYYKQFGLPGHEGVDFRAPHGTPVKAAQRGAVQLVGVGPKYGQQIVIVHGDYGDGLFETIYAHLIMGSPTIKNGDQVSMGQVIGLSDNTGNSSGDHLHFTLKKHGVKNGGYGEIIDPEPYFSVASPNYQPWNEERHKVLDGGV